MTTGIVRVRNVNWALLNLLNTDMSEWRDISPRGMKTLEHPGPFITEYTNPTERVLFSPARDANPFFHLMEALWILAGRNDVAFLAKYNAKMKDYSDDGVKFNAPYGYRLRHHFRCAEFDEHGVIDVNTVDQIQTCIGILRGDNSSRQAVLTIWDPARDLGLKTKDMPCNDMLFLKVRDGALHMTILCRSNDAIWGAYGANAVQFSVLQEYIASMAGVEVGTMVQVSDSFHVYTENESDQVWHRMNDERFNSDQRFTDPYSQGPVCVVPLFADWPHKNGEWLRRCEEFCEGEIPRNSAWPSFFRFVAHPMRMAWDAYKQGDIPLARTFLDIDMIQNCDWTFACDAWITRREASKKVRP